MWGNPTLFHRAKSVEKKYCEKVNQLRKAF